MPFLSVSVFESHLYDKLIVRQRDSNFFFYWFHQAAGLQQPIDERLVEKIHDLVSCGVNRVSEMVRHLQYFVKKEIFAGKKSPEATNRRFFPTSMDVRNHRYRATVACRHSQIDQENLKLKIKEWEKESPEDRFFFLSAKQP